MRAVVKTKPARDAAFVANWNEADCQPDSVQVQMTAAPLGIWFTLWARQVNTPPEQLHMQKARNLVDFPLLFPRRVPWGYYLTEVMSVPEERYAIILLYRNRSGRQWTIRQRKSALSFEQELEGSGEEYVLQEMAGRPYAFTRASWFGEPVERHRTSSRQTLWWHQGGDRMIEIEKVGNHSPSWRGLRRVARRMQLI
jgi:hypothetical protein